MSTVIILSDNHSFLGLQRVVGGRVCKGTHDILASDRASSGGQV